MTDEPLLQAVSLRRTFGRRTALHELDLEVASGEVVGLLGPNGAGKTTALRLLSGCLAPSAGRVRVAGHDLVEAPKSAKAVLGYLPEQPPLYRDLTVDEYLDYSARLHGIAARHRASARERTKARCGLVADGRRLIGNLSKGYQQRVGIAQALLHNPPLVILDEPTVGLDPNQVREIRNLIIELGREHAVLLSTHVLSEVEAICDRVMILNQGRVVHGDRVRNPDQGAASFATVCRFRSPPESSDLAQLAGVLRVEPLGASRFRLYHETPGGLAEALVGAAVNGRWGLLELTPERPSLEQLFVELTCRDDFA